MNEKNNKEILDLELLIAKHIMGWTDCKIEEIFWDEPLTTSKISGGFWSSGLPPNSAAHRCIPSYYTDDSTAMQVVKQLRSWHYCCSILATPENYQVGFFLHPKLESSGKLKIHAAHTAIDKSLAAAICKAAYALSKKEHSKKET